MNQKPYTSGTAGFLRRLIFIAIFASAFVINSFAQISGTIAIPSANYPTIKVAVDSLNLYGVAGGGGVTFDVAAGYTETLTGRIDLTATGSVTDPIVFQKSGAGANPVITSYTGTALASAVAPDGMIALIGSDYVTFDAINLTEAAGNTTPTTIMEYGFGLFKASGTDGANNNTIKNCVITLNRNNTTGSTVGFINSAGAIGGSMGIALTNCTPTTATTAITVTSVNGASSNNKFYSNTIQNVHCGISLAGFAGAIPFTLCDFNNEIGGSSAATGNTIINFGGGTTPLTACAAVFFSNQWDLNFSYNTVNNNNGSGVNHTATNRGIWAFASSNGASATINNNTLTITGSSTTYDMGIDCEMTQTAASGNTININNNTISVTKTNSVSQLASAIWLNSSPTTLNCNGNIITNFTCPSTATTDVGVIRSGFAGIGTLNINNNNISGVNFNAATGTNYIIGVTAAVTTALNINGNNINGVTLTGATTKVLTGISSTAAANTATVSISNNNFENFNRPGTGAVTFISGVGTPLNQTISGNTFTNLSIASTGSATFIAHSYTVPAGGLQTINGNNIVGSFNKTGAGGTVACMTSGASTIANTLTSHTNNNFSNITVTGATILNGITNTDGLSTIASPKVITGNTFSNWTGGTSAITVMSYTYFGSTSSLSNNIITNITGQAAITCINVGASGNTANPLNISSNTINNITSTGTGGAVLGITCTNTSAIVNVNSNTINTMSSTGASAVTGISIGGATNTSIFKNKIYDLAGSNASSTVNGILISAGTLVNIYNNIVGDLRTPIANAANPLNGINITGGTTINASYNTVRLAATSTGALFGSSALSASTTPNLTLRNNILVNLSSFTGTGIVAAYRRSSTTITTHNAASNNNLFYAGTPSANNLIFYDGTNSDQTVMAYKIRVFSADANSGTENPTFLSTVGANANFLHVDPSVATNVESGAANIAGITDDFDSEIRQGNGGYVGTGTAPDIGADEISGIPAAALAPPINFTFNTATTTSFNITWDDNSTGEAGFVVFRSLNIGGPFNTIVGAVVSTTAGTTGTTYTLPQTGLLGGTTYYYQVVANNFTSSAPLSGNATTLSCGGGYAGTFTIPGTPFPSIKEALDSLVLFGMSGPVILELDPTYVGAGETYPLTISNLIGCLNPTNTLTIRPSATVATPLIITSANTTATIDINGANFVTIDGRPGGVGSNKYLIIENTSTTAASAGNAILLRNEASNNTITYCDVRSANANIPTNGAITTVGAIPGAIAIGTTSGGFGNDNNTISFCDVHSLTAGGNLGACIYSGNATTAGSNANNDNNIIDSCNIYDFYLPTSASAGIDISLGNNNWTITNNHVYQQSVISYAAGTQAVRGIWVTPNTGSLTSASGFTISGNYIGGNAANGTGAYTITGTANYVFRGMDISVGLGAATSIQNNTITNMNITGGFSGNSVYGIDVANGNLNMGTVTGNMIGSAIATGAITITTTVTNGSFIGLRSGAGGTINFSNNTVAGIDMIGNATTVATGFNGIAASGGATITVNNNTIGSATIPNSINIVATSATSTTAAAVRGIICNSGTAGANNTVTNNLVANINSNYSATGSQANTLVGISVTTGTSIVSGNTVRDLSSNTQTTSGGGTSAIVGIAYTSTTAPAVISDNTIHTLKLTHPSAITATANQAIFYGGPATGTSNMIERNFIHSISMASPTNAAGVLSGMDVASGLVTIKNNMIRLGLDETGASIVSPCLIRGITDNSASTNIWFNSIYIGGSGVDVTATNTFALVRTGAGTDDWRNNILVNERSNATTGGKHYAINLNATTTLTLNYNDYYGTGTGYVFGAVGVTDFASYATNWVAGDANSYNDDPKFISPTGTAATVDLHINPSIATIIEGTGTPIGSVTNDFDNQTRALLTPTDMGADAGNFISLVCNGTPDGGIASTSATPLCISGVKTISVSGFTNVPGISLQWQESPVSGGPYTNVTGGTGATTATYTTPTLTSTTYYVCLVTCSNGGATAISTEATALVSNPTITGTTPGERCGTGPVTICATGSAGTVLSWYNAPTGGSPLTYPYSAIAVTGYNNDIVASGVGTGVALSMPGTSYPLIGIDGVGYTFIDNTYKWQAANALPTCNMPTNNLAPSLLTPGLTYTLEDYNANNALTLDNNSTDYLDNTFSNTGSLTLTTPASYGTLKVLYESVVNVSPLTVDVVVTFSDATTQTFSGINGVNWFSGTPALTNVARAQNVSPGLGSSCPGAPNLFEMTLALDAGNYSKLVQSINFTIPTVLSSGAFPYNVNYFHAMAVAGNEPAPTNCYTTPSISSTTTYYVSASTAGGSASGGRMTNVAGSVLSASPRGIIFNTTAAVDIDSVSFMCSGVASTVTIQLYNAGGTATIGSPIAINIPANGGTSTTPVLLTFAAPMSIPGAGTYRLFVTSVAPTGNVLWYEFSGVTGYPYQVGPDLSITSSVTSLTGTASLTTYYYFYKLVVKSACSSSPRTAVIATVNTPPAFAITPSQTVCNNAIAMLNVTSPSANYDSVTWAPIANLFTDAAAAIPYTGGNEDTVYFSSATHSANTITCTGNNTLTPFCSNSATTTVNVHPVSATVTSTAASLCFSGSATLGLNPASPYAAGSIQWQVSSDSITFTNIGGATNSSYTTPVIDTTTYYRAIIKNSNGDTCFFADAVVTVNEPAILTTTGASSCIPAILTLNATATSGGTINWYAAATGGAPLFTGTSYNTPLLNTTTTYYAAASSGGFSANTGMAASLPTATSGAGTTNFGLVFDALSSFSLTSVTVYPVSAASASGTVTIDVINSAGAVLHTVTANVVGSPAATPVAHVINCNFNILPGTNMKMRPGFTGITGLLFEPSASAPSGNYGYPYVVPGVLSINTSTLTAAPTNTPRNDLYYYFYNWVVTTGCEGPRVPVIAAISTVPTSISTVTNPVVTCTPGGSVTLSVASSNGVLANGGSWEYQWMDETGTSVLQAWNASSNFNVIAVSGLNKYRIYMRNTACPVDSGFDYASFVVGITGSAIGVSPTGCSPTGSIIVTATGSGVLTDWYNNDFTSPVLGAAAAVTGSAAVTGGQCVITPNMTSQSGAFQVFNPGAISAANYQIDFDLGVLPSGADGISYSFGDDVSPTATPPQFECGTGSKFKLAFDSYSNTGGNIPGIYLMYNCNVDLQPPAAPGVLAYVSNTSWLNATTHVTIIIDPSGFVTVKLNNVPVISNVQLPAAYLTANRSTWTHVFRARTGGIAEAHNIDNLVVKYNAFEYSINGPGGPWQVANAFSGLPVGSYSVWVRNPADTTCMADLGIFVLDYPDSINTLATDTVLCISGTSTLSMSPLLAGATYQWDSSSVSSSGPWFPITGATAATYLANISATAWYRCNISCAGTPITGSPSVVREVHVNNPQVIDPIPGSRCGIGTVDLSATPSAGATINWFATLTGGTSIGTGNSFTTPAISSTTTYYAEATTTGGTATGGRLTNVAGSVLSASPRGIIFTTTNAVDIDSIGMMCSGVASSVTVQLYNAGGTATIGAPVVLNIPANAGTSTTPVLLTFAAPISIPAAGTYRLFVTSVAPTGNVLWYEFSGVTGYPYQVGTDLTITSSVTSLTGAASLTTYYYFYKLTVGSSCNSNPRTPVTATVTAPPVITFGAVLPICAGASTNLSVTSVNDPNYSYTWEPGGFSGPTITVSPAVTTKFTVTAIDNSNGPDSGCVAIDSITVVVNSLPNIVSAQASLSTICGSGSPVTLTALTSTSTPGFANVGTQTTTISGNTGNPYRSGSVVGNEIRTQLLYTVSELNAAGLAAGNITSLAFTATGAAGTVINFTIKIGNTASSVLTTTYETTPMTTVFTQASFTAIIGVNTHAFSTPFNWNGTSNILVEICQQNSVIGTTTVAAYTPGFASNTGNTAVGGCTALTGLAAANKPIIRFGGQVGGGLGAGTLGWQWAPGVLPSGNIVVATPTANTEYTVTATDGTTGCTSTATVSVIVTPQPHPFLQQGDSILCSNDLGFDMVALDTGIYAGGYPSGTTINFLGAGAILYQTGTSNVFFNQNNSDAFYVEVILPGYLGGCTALSDTSVIDFGTSQAPQYLLSTDSVKCYGESNGNAIVNITFGGSPDFRYQWYDSGMNNLLRDTTTAGLTDSLKGVPAGMYVVVITDHQGATVSPYCSVTDSVYVGQPDGPLTVSENLAAHVDILCNGNSTGNIDIEVAGGTVAYNYSWSNSATTEDLAGVPAGTYTCSITDQRGCTTSITVTLTEPTALVLNPVVNQIPCNGGTGSVTLNVAGGVGPYLYSWSNGNTTQTNSNLVAGSYDVTVTDANGCTMISTYEISPAPELLTVNCSSTNNSCFNSNNGTVSVLTSGGTSPYSYLWSNGSTLASQASLAKGTYTVTVTDINGCSASCSTVITQPSKLIISYTKVNPTSILPYSGSITTNVSGSVAPYTFAWSSGQTTQNISGLAGGTYTLIVTDANGCTSSVIVNLTYTCRLGYINTVITLPSCGIDNGVASVLGTGGTSYTYAWQTTPVQTTSVATGLSYYFNSYVLVTDVVSGCSVMDTVTLPTSNGLLLTLTSPVYAGGKNIRCYGGSDGSIQLTVSGSTGPYTYLWNTGATTQNLTGLPAGTYMVTVSNGGCTNSNLITLTQPTLLTAAATATNATCASLGSATATPSGGVSPYTYSWNTVPVKTTKTATGLTAGIYTVTISDANGCTATATAVVASTSGLTVTGVVTNVSCFGGTNGKITLTVSGGVGPYTYLWNNGSTVKNRTTLAPGTYTVTVTDINGCTGTYSATITQPTAITAIVTSQTNVTCYGGVNGTAVVAVSGGTPAYTYSWNTIPVQTTATATGLKKGTYTLTITDSKGCLKGVSVIITQPSVINISISKTNVSTYGGNNGSATANVTGGVSPYSYSWNTVPVKTTQMATGLVAGTYTVTVTDANGCTKTKSVTITQPLAKVINGSQADNNNTISSVIYPNPTSGRFTVSFDESISTNVSLQVFDVTGVRVLDKDLEVNEQSSSFEVDLSDLPKGIYFIRYRTNDKNWIERLVIQ